ncbi:polymorphic toxin type 30 domain-containing protein [Bacillus pseudomycoides]|uniref:polymorphic toxin type 30 domain-containing protein n=1 Tax=Bacillus pseudomycoides TaxID=64104 RepID=UPI001FB1D57E|nr:polymorphic toxin type 30 domain-containing protein [Bacillus pseudomycoides]
MATEFFNVNDSIIAADWTLLNVTPIGRIGKGIKYVGKKAGKALLDVAKKVPSKVKEGVSFVASKTKSLVDKVGDLWNKGKTKVKNDFIEADKAFRYAMKKLGEYVPKSGRDLAFATESAGKIPGRGKNLLKDAYQYVKETGEKVFGSGEKNGGKEASGAGKLGTGNIGDFSNIQGATIDDILSRIPKDAPKRDLSPQPGKVTEGFEYKWEAPDGSTMRVRVHGPDASAPAGSNAANGWIVRVQKGKKYFDPISGEFQPPGIVKPNSSHYNEGLANSTYIPIQPPKK